MGRSVLQREEYCGLIKKAEVKSGFTCRCKEKGGGGGGGGCDNHRGKLNDSLNLEEVGMVGGIFESDGPVLS